MSADVSPGRPSHASDPRLPIRARKVLRVPMVWIVPLVLGSVVLAAMTALYIGSVVDPVGHMHGLPVAVVDQDRGAAVGPRQVNIGAQVVTGLKASPAVSTKLRLNVMTLSEAQNQMGRGKLYTTMVIPSGLTTNLLQVAGLQAPTAKPATTPRIDLLTNPQAGTLGASLAAGVLQPALGVASRQVGRQLTALVPPGAQTAATTVLLADPVSVTTTPYRALTSHSAVGLSAFYLALLTLFGGFLAGTTVNTVVDSALGYTSSEIGPRWSQRPPLAISRWQTLLIKWPLVVVLAGVGMAVVELVAVAGLSMDAPHPGLLWLYDWLCASSVGIGTVVLFAVAGTSGQLLALLIFVYAGLASAGGTVPVEALPPFLRAISTFEPLRQILGGARSILYFGAQADAGLARGLLTASLGLLFWLVLGAAIVRWYDRKGLYRLHPDILAYVSSAAQNYMAQDAVPERSRSLKDAQQEGMPG